jgi:hypothetical protein
MHKSFNIFLLTEKSDFLEKSDFFNPQNVKTLLRICLIVFKVEVDLLRQLPKINIPTKYCVELQYQELKRVFYFFGVSSFQNVNLKLNMV